MSLTKVTTRADQPSPNRTRRSTRRIATALGIVVATVALGACSTWGLKESYRGYVAGPIAGGTITATDGATRVNGPGTAKGPFQWTIESSAFDPETETGYVQLTGTVKTAGHAAAGGNVLELEVSNPRLEIDGDEGILVADLNYRPFLGFGPTVAPLAAATDVDFGSVDLSGVDWTPNASGSYTVGQAPMTGIPAAMQLIGWDQFYGPNIALDPLTVSFKPTAPQLAATPSIKVSRTTDLHFGDTVTVWGRGFDPDLNVGTRPPLAGQKSGVYAVFGKFPTTWQPSAGIPSSSRTIIAQKWALPQSSRDLLDPAGTSPSFVTIDQYGRFEATLPITENASVAGNYGVYVFAGGGAVRVAHEHGILTTVG